MTAKGGEAHHCYYQAGKGGVKWSEIWNGDKVTWGKAGKLSPVFPHRPVGEGMEPL